MSKSVVLRPRLPEGRAGKHQHGAYYLQRAELLVQEYGREYKRAYRVDVAEQRHAARGQPVHAGEVQPAGQTRVHQTEEDEVQRPLRVGREADVTPGQQHIGQHDAGRDDRLDGRERQAGDAVDLLVENYQTGVECSAAQADDEAGGGHGGVAHADGQH